MSVSVIFDLLYMAVLLIFILVGIYRGFIKSFLGSVRLILSFLLAHLFGGALGEFLRSAFLGEWIYGGVHGTVPDLVGDATAELGASDVLSAFPEFLIGDSVHSAVDEAISSYSGEMLISAVSSAIADPISSLISGILGYVIVFLLSFLLWKLIAWLGTKLADQISLLGFLNRFLGGAWGALTGAVWLLLASAVIRLFFRGSEVYTDTVIVRWFCDLPLLSFLNI